MQLYIITTDTASDYDQSSAIIGGYLSEEKAAEKFNEIRNHLREKYAGEDGWEIGTDTDNCFEAYEEGFAARNHDYITLHTVEPEQEPARYAIDFGGNVMAKIEIENGEPKVLEAMNGYGYAFDKDEIRIHKLSN